MDRLWSPWRYVYLKHPRAEGPCVFCNIAASDQDEANLVVHRGRRNFIVLNLFPYTSGHAMVVPYEHVPTLEACSDETLVEMVRLTRRLESAIRRQYGAEALNIGMNVGAAAGAGVAGHIHMHVVPRWVADSNFMTVIGETRILPEELPVTLEKLRSEFADSSETL